MYKTYTNNYGFMSKTDTLLCPKRTCIKTQVKYRNKENKKHAYV